MGTLEGRRGKQQSKSRRMESDSYCSSSMQGGDGLVLWEACKEFLLCAASSLALDSAANYLFLSSEN